MRQCLYFFIPGVLFFFAACAPQPRQAMPQLPAPLRAPLPEKGTMEAPPAETRPARTGFLEQPAVPLGRTALVGEQETVPPDFKSSQPIKISLESVPLPAFINEIFGNLLGLAFHLDPALQKNKDLVTLRIPEALPPADLYRQARQVLESYGVGILRQGGLMQFVPAPKDQSAEPPLLWTGDTLPEVPASHRPIFQVIPLKALHHTQVTRLLTTLYNNPQLKITGDVERNSVMLSGPPQLLKQAAEAVRLLDRPFMRGRRSLRIEPAFIEAEQLARRLVDTLRTEGYSADLGFKEARGAITVTPVEETNSVFVFAGSQSILTHVKEWALELDRPGNLGRNESGLFIYPVRNTQAEGISKTLQPLLQKTPYYSPGTVNQAPPPAASSSNAAAQNTASAGLDVRSDSRMVVDPIRNALLFQGETAEWARLLPILKELDKPAKQVLVEVTVAEVTLNDDEQFGIEWFLHGGSERYEHRAGTLRDPFVGTKGLGLGVDGLTYTLLNGLGQTRATLNALARNSRVNVLSTPRLMVKSGESALINVGTEVPILTSQSTDPGGTQAAGNSAILQQIQYRRTGITLEVKAVVHSGNRVDLGISQEVSLADDNTTSDIGSPMISNRNIETKLTLRDGGSVLLGGLISDRSSSGTRGVPGLSRIPILGHLFKVDEETAERTELIVLIVPYVINNSVEAEAVTESFRRRLEFEDFSEEDTEPQSPPTVVPKPNSVSPQS